MMNLRTQVFFGLAAFALLPVVANAQESVRSEGLPKKQAEEAKDVKKAENTRSAFEFHSYTRLGVNTSANPTEAARSEQGFGTFGLWTSRHVRNPNYLRLNFTANMNQNMRAEFEVDNEQTTPHEDSQFWSGNAFRIRNAFLEMPVGDGQGKYIWAGSRRIETEDIRLLDTRPLSPDNIYGGGVHWGMSTTALSVSKNPVAVTDKTTGQNLGKVDGKSLMLFQRFDIPLAERFSVKPMAILTHNAAIRSQRIDGSSSMPGGTSKHVNSVTDIRFGAVLSQSSETGTWANHFAYMGTARASQGTSTSVPKASEKDITLGVAESADIEISEAQLGVLVGARAEYTRYKNDQQEYKISDGYLVPDGSHTTKNGFKTSLDVQPVYYITDHFHGALDLNYAIQTKLAADAGNVFLITPILRYAANRSAIGTPQIYTSLTYGAYNAKLKRDVANKPTKELVTTQSGFELWF